MMIPVRCFTCNKVIGNKWEAYNRNIQEGIEPDENFKKLGISRYCCKRMFLSHVEVIDKLLMYVENHEDVKKE